MDCPVPAWFVLVLVGIASFSRPGSAQAAGEPSVDAERRHRVRVRGESPDLSFELFRLVDGAPLARCEGECIVALRSGKYGLRVLERGALVGERRVAVQRPATWTVSPNDPALRSLGLGLGIAGPVLLVAGALLITPVLGSGLCHDSEGCTTAGERQGAALGFFALTGGAVATPIGWTLFASNLRPRLEVAPLNAPSASSTPSWGFGVSGTF